jgi:redox-sensitive bicupin YhaK (pirin superfamily)
MRSIGSPGLSVIDPFLLLDEFISDDPDDYIAGFPPHPHRGFETVTYMINGLMRHEDSAGNRGELGTGGVQWMTAGRGVIHSEMPMQEAGLMHGFQLWINLPASQKMMEPRYQNIDSSEIPVIKNEGHEVKIIAGTFREIVGPVNGVITDPLYLDVKLNPDTDFQFPYSDAHVLLAYLFEGEADFGSGLITKSNVVVFSDEGILKARAGKDGARFLLLGAKPINEPIFRSGPFVMNTREEIEQAYKDFR